MCSTNRGIKAISPFCCWFTRLISNQSTALNAGLVVFVLTERCSVTKTHLHRCVTHILLARDISACFTSWQSDSLSLIFTTDRIISHVYGQMWWSTINLFFNSSLNFLFYMFSTSSFLRPASSLKGPRCHISKRSAAPSTSKGKK